MIISTLNVIRPARPERLPRGARSGRGARDVCVSLARSRKTGGKHIF